MSPLADASAGAFPPAEHDLVAPHAVKDDGGLSRHGDTGLGHAAALGNTHTPRLQGRPFLAARQQRMRCLVKRGASEFIVSA